MSRTKLFIREVIHSFNDKDYNILMLDRHELTAGSTSRPDIMKVNTMDGRVMTEVKNPGEVRSWGLDFDGIARVGILSHGDQSGAIYRENEKTPWRTIMPLQDRLGQMRPIGFDREGDKVFVTALTKAGRIPESRFMANLGHTYGNEKQRTEIYKAVIAFLEKNLGPGVP